MKKIASTTAAALLLTGLLSACGGNDSNNASNSASKAPAASQQSSSASSADAKKDPVTLRFVSFGAAKAELFGKIVAAFNESHPNITVEFTTNTQNYHAQLKTQLATGEAPDIVTHLIGKGMVPYVEADHLMDLSNESFIQKLQPAALESVTYEGKVYGIPLDTQAWGVYYNKQLFQEAGITELPRTYSDFKSVVQTFKDKGITPFAVNYRDAWSLGQFATIGYSPQVVADVKGNPDSFKPGSWSFNTPEFKSVLTALDLVIDNAQERAVDTDLSGQTTLFATGKTAMMVTGNWSLLQLRKLNPELDAGMFPLPFTEQPENNVFPADYALCLNIISHTKHPEEAKLFIDFLLDSQGPAGFYYDEIGTPSALTNSAAKLDPVSDELKAALDQNKTVSWFQNLLPEGFDGEVWKAVQSYATMDNRDHDKFAGLLDNLFANTK